MNSDFLLAMGIILGVLVTLAVLFRPFFGLLVFLATHFVQPGELIPALGPLRVLVHGGDFSLV